MATNLQIVNDYRIIFDDMPHKLEEDVREAMQDGWVPSGPMVVYRDGIGQSMVKFRS